MPCSADGCACASRAAATAWGTTPFCSRPRPRRSRASARWSWGAAWARPVSRSPRACPVTLVEIDPQLCALATANARTNALADRVEVLCLDLAAPAALHAAGLDPGSVDRVLMNPPFSDATRQNVSPDHGRRLAHAASPETLALWIDAAARLLAPGGVLTLIWRADGLADVVRALDAAFGGVTVLPVHSKAGEPAIRILVRATKASRAPLALLPGFALNDGAGRPTEAAEAVLRAGAVLPLAEI
jgi:tRNA1(Val) A37 N6-methylase TrmN6